ncbi:lens fiber membrane intrinsic protein-like [Littorina saxatilis]|uniref:Uncharacterized protein n=1 Tax=Littorina saxatilis TaxID=31220 RepID=A0AAN9AR69_9CAEN
MGFKMPPIFSLVAMGCAGVGLIFQIVGVATPGWVTADSADVERGLWKICVNSVCGDISAVYDATGTKEPAFYGACRAFGILGVLALAGCLAVGALTCFMEMDKLPLFAAILGFVAGVCILIEFAVYAGEIPTMTGTSYGYSFALTIIAWLLAMAAGALFIVSKIRVVSA